jgi:hypothetical protein
MLECQDAAISYKHDTVDSVSFSLAAAPTVGDLLTAYGSPDHVSVSPTLVTNGEITKTTMWLLHDRFPMQLVLAEQDRQLFSINGTTLIIRAVYDSSREYGLSIGAAVESLQPWHGYGDYAPESH